jgi:hypothetical protein
MPPTRPAFRFPLSAFLFLALALSSTAAEIRIDPSIAVGDDPFLFLALALSSTAAEIRIDPAPPSIAVGDDLDLAVSGLPWEVAGDPDLARVTYWPREKVRLRTSMTWTREPFIMFRARLPGSYLIAVDAVVDGQLCHSETVVTVTGPPDPDPDPGPDANPYRPDPRFRPAVGPVLKIATSRADSIALSKVYSQIAGRIRTQAAGLGSYQDLSDLIAASAKPLGLRGKYPGLAAALAEAFAELATHDRQLEPDRAGAFLETLAWAVWESGAESRKRKAESGTAHSPLPTAH